MLIVASLLTAVAGLPVASDDQHVRLTAPLPINCSAPKGIEQSLVVDVPLELRAAAGQPARQAPLELSIEDKSNGAVQGQVAISDANILLSARARAEQWVIKYTVLNNAGCSSLRSIEIVSEISGPNTAQPFVAAVSLLGQKAPGSRELLLPAWMARRYGRQINGFFGRNFHWLEWTKAPPTSRDDQCWKCKDPRWARMWHDHARLLSGRELEDVPAIEGFLADYANWAEKVEFFVAPPVVQPGNPTLALPRHPDDKPAFGAPVLVTGMILTWGTDQAVLAFQPKGAADLSVRLSRLSVQGVAAYDEAK